MNIKRVNELYTLSSELALASLAPNIQQEAAAAIMMLKIIRKGIQAYEEQTGLSFDSSMVEAEAL